VTDAPAHEPPVYRPFALLAFGTTVFVATPLGIRVLAWLYCGAPAVGPGVLLLHASLQSFGFFGVLILGVAQHLVPRFTGRAVTPSPLLRALAVVLGVVAVLRIASVWLTLPAAALAAAAGQSAAFVIFAGWVWRSLDPPALAPLRRHLTASSGWLAAASIGETLLRCRALVEGAPAPDHAAMRAVHAMALLGGVVGWILGVLVRAGPMFAPDWRVAPAVVGAMPLVLGLGVLLHAAGELGDVHPMTASAVSRLGDTVALGLVSLVLIGAGALRRGGRRLPMLSRSPQESRIFRLAAVSVVAATLGSAVAAIAALDGVDTHVLTDAARHLLAVGFITSVVVAMTFRLIPVLEARALPWPRLRDVAFWSLLAAVVLRTIEVFAGMTGGAVGPLVALSGPLAWTAVTCAAANLAGALARR
jgi:uncharacterized protein involved in response to NO